MTASSNKTKRRLLLASDRTDHSSELATILQSVGEVKTVATSDIPEKPEQLSGVIVDINLRSPESVQTVRNKLRNDAYREMPRLFVLADALHHGVGFRSRALLQHQSARRLRSAAAAPAPRLLQLLNCEVGRLTRFLLCVY